MLLYSQPIMTRNMGKQTNPTRWVDPDASSRPIFVLSDRHDSVDGPWHSHRRAQFLHVSGGALTVLTRTMRVIISPRRGIWIGADVQHRIMSKTAFWLTTCYVDPGLLSLPDRPCVFAVDTLADELLIAASSSGGDYPAEGPEARLAVVLLDRLQSLPSADIVLTEPRDLRLKRITDRLFADPSDNTTLDQLAADAAMTGRTAARLFVRDTGLTFGAWRQHMRLQASLEHLASGRSVTETAFAVGYTDASAFISAFRRLFGRTPAQHWSRQDFGAAFSRMR